MAAGGTTVTTAKHLICDVPLRCFGQFMAVQKLADDLGAVVHLTEGCAGKSTAKRPGMGSIPHAGPSGPRCRPLPSRPGCAARPGRGRHHVRQPVLDPGWQAVPDLRLRRAVAVTGPCADSGGALVTARRRPPVNARPLPLRELERLVRQKPLQAPPQPVPSLHQMAARRQIVPVGTDSPTDDTTTTERNDHDHA